MICCWGFSHKMILKRIVTLQSIPIFKIQLWIMFFLCIMFLISNDQCVFKVAINTKLVEFFNLIHNLVSLRFLKKIQDLSQ
jgi:hypothetical protein